MSIAEDLCQALSGITFVNDDSLLLVLAKVHIDEKEGWIRVIVVIITSSSFSFIICSLLFLIILLVIFAASVVSSLIIMELWQLCALRYLTIVLSKPTLS